MSTDELAFLASRHYPIDRVNPKDRLQLTPSLTLSFELWAIFTACLVAVGSQLRHSYPAVAWGGLAVACFLVAFHERQRLLRARQLRRDMREAPGLFEDLDVFQQPTAHYVATALVCVAAVAGVALGEREYGGVQWELERSHLRTYSIPVDPLAVRGAAMQDAGMIVFTDTSTVDRSRVACFAAAADTYCAAPIVDAARPGATPFTGSVDFFAVGVNCCACPGDFHCGDATLAQAHAGLRELSGSERSFYRLAVEQWSAAWQAESREPLFLHWSVHGGDRAVDRALRDVDFALVSWSCVLMAFGVAASLSVALWRAASERERKVRATLEGVNETNDGAGPYGGA